MKLFSTILEKNLPVLFSLSVLLQPLNAHSSIKDKCLIADSNTTILQIWNEDLQRTENEWKQIFSQIKAISFDKVILQWTLFKDKNKSEYLYIEHTISELLEKLYVAASASSIQISVGLIYDDQFWQKISGTDRDVENYFSKRLYQLNDHVRNLTALIEKIDSTNTVFSSWYVSDEIDNLSWAVKSRSTILFRYLKSVCDILKNSYPDWPIMITGYTAPLVPNPQEHALFWKNLLTQSGIDQVLYQDSIGTGKISLTYWLVLLREFQKTLGPGKLSVIVELFDIKHEVDGGISYTATDFKRVSEQISIANEITSSNLVFFTAFDYLLDETVVNSKNLLEHWTNSIETCKLSNSG